MKEYKKLRTYSYDNYEMIVEKRKNSKSSMNTGLNMQTFYPRNQILLPEEVELFFLCYLRLLY